MRDLAFRRILQYAALVIALAVAGAFMPDVAAAQGMDTGTGYRTTTTTTKHDKGMDIGWIGLLGLAGLLGLRKRDTHHRHENFDNTTTTKRNVT
ncbi:MAG TPA: WGxxGxxG family protein [Microbacterium sp.]|nr:WGxxGxxG family protein [Microbacterium sp.]